jgi:hypothetical protein
MTKTQSNAPARFIQVNEALALIEGKLAESMNESGEISEQDVELLTAFAEESARNVDSLAEWFQEIVDRAAYCKQREQEFYAARKQAEDALDRIKKLTTVYLDAKLQLQIAGGADPDKAKPKLEGETKSIWTQAAGIASLIIDEGAEIPAEFKYREMTVKIAADLEQEVVEGITEYLAGFEIEFKYDPESEPIVNNQLLRAAIESGTEIEGVRLEKTRYLRWSKARALKPSKEEESE